MQWFKYLHKGHDSYTGELHENIIHIYEDNKPIYSFLDLATEDEYRQYQINLYNKNRRK